MSPRLPALEKNILKYRAVQMVLLLHQVESFRSFVIGSIRATDALPTKSTTPRLPPGAKRPLETAFAILVQEGVINQADSADLQKIVDIRNRIGHKIHELLADISSPELSIARDPVYDYFAFQRFEEHRKKVENGMLKLFILQIGFREVAFEQAEYTYKEELHRLKRRIEKQFNARRAAA